jgi:hypothetical protein
MTGGCEEVVAVGCGIGTGAGTGVKLDKQGEADMPLIIMGGRAEPLKANGGWAKLLQSKQSVFG